MDSEVDLGDLKIEVVRKDIKNLHLGVHPPTGQVRISAPMRMSLDAIRAFALTKLGWIRQQQRKINEQEREPAREFLDRESHYVWGKRYLLKIVESTDSQGIELTQRELILRVRPGTTKLRMAAILESWYRNQIKEVVPELIEKWAAILGVKVDRVFIQQMKTRWGGCNPDTGIIRLNTELARKPTEYLEYVVIHELVHLIEPTHNARFIMLMDQSLPNWRQIKDELNRLPLRDEIWS